MVIEGVITFVRYGALGDRHASEGHGVRTFPVRGCRAGIRSTAPFVFSGRKQPASRPCHIVAPTLSRRATKSRLIAVTVLDWKAFISADPLVMHGALCLRGTRVPISVVLDNLAEGESVERILDQYPSLTPEHISAALAFAAELARERIVAVPA